jgi:hypothetical protein
MSDNTLPWSTRTCLNTRMTQTTSQSELSSFGSLTGSDFNTSPLSCDHVLLTLARILILMTWTINPRNFLNGSKSYPYVVILDAPWLFSTWPTLTSCKPSSSHQALGTSVFLTFSHALGPLKFFFHHFDQLSPSYAHRVPHSLCSSFNFTCDVHRP